MRDSSGPKEPNKQRELLDEISEDETVVTDLDKLIDQGDVEYLGLPFDPDYHEPPELD